MALDLRQEKGRELLMRLLAEADVLVENFKPGTLEKWGLGYDVLHECFPRLVHCRISGFGADGPSAVCLVMMQLFKPWQA
ncbi:E-cinnamoyl-CoA:R-phenyllactate CoA transferase [Halomonas elongata]|uniref:E-cinnamoyl-CoA:R-phenyllactate CoA transferase n=1 Tax=Halomonas elongata TaxID=2746 RepID=A0A1B8P6L8_HALEL|nr:E-cinnamoyl-CoA:R-phenyllactate CoA transferase [Halomonas elongata]